MKKFHRWLEWCAFAAAVLIALVAVYQFFFANVEHTGMGSFALYQRRAAALASETDPVKRDAMGVLLSSFGRSFDGQFPTNARVFLAGMLGPENSGNVGYFYFLSYYLFPREVSISLGEPPVYSLGGPIQGRNPASLDELATAGYNVVMQLTPDGQLEYHEFKPFPPAGKPVPISTNDEIIAFLLPLAVALAGSRVVRWLFRELEMVLSLGELLACGLALGAFILTQGVLALRMAGLRLEHVLDVAVMIWAVAEVILLFRQRRAQLFKFHARQLWWLLLVPAGLVLWCLFRLAGLEGLLEFDAVAFWALKAKIFYLCAGPDIWTWFKNPALAYAHLDYPLLASLLHTLTYGAIGHVNEFVTKFWNQWMLLFIGWAILGAGRFPRQKPWLVAAVATTVILLPLTLEFTRAEGGTIPMVFFVVVSSLQLAVGMMEKQPARIRLGLLLLMATAMVKFEGIVLLAFWSVLLLLDKDSRAAFWPLRRIGLAGPVGIAGWVPYLIFRLHHPVPHPESAWLGNFWKHIETTLSITPMTDLAFVSRRFLNNDFAAWGSPDNHHAVWQGKWVGWESLFDQATIGLGWVCLLALLAAWYQGGSLRWTMARLALIFFSFSVFIGFVWSATHADPLNYAGALGASERIGGGRYLLPALLSWFVAGFVLLVRAGKIAPDVVAAPVKKKPVKNKPSRRPR